MSATIVGNWTIDSAPAAPFSPSDIAGLQLWLKADSLALSDGDPVSTWTDSSGNNNDATAAGSARPLYKTNIFNGKPALEFDTTDDGMSIASINVVLPFTLFIVYAQITTGSGSHRAIQGRTSNWLLGPFDSTNHQYYNGAFIIGPAVTFNVPIIACVTQATGAAEYFVNTTSQGTNANNTAPGGLQLGDGSGSPPFPERLSGHIAEVVCYDTVLSSGNRASVHTYLNSRYSVY